MDQSKKRGFIPTAEHIRQIEVLASTGDTLDQIGDAFMITKRQLETAFKNYPEFRDAWVKGRDKFFTFNVEKSLLKRIIGYYYYENTHEPIDKKPEGMTRDEHGNPVLHIVKKVRKHVPAESSLLVFYLTNRMPTRWKHIRRMEVADLLNLNDDQSVTPEEQEELKTYAQWRVQNQIASAKKKSKAKLKAISGGGAETISDGEEELHGSYEE